jgi:hypothetical protein
MHPEHSSSLTRLATAVLVLAVVFAAGLSQAATNLNFVPEVEILDCEDAWAIDIWVDATAVDLRGLSLVIEFDPALVLPVAVEAGQLFIDAPCVSVASWNNQTDIGDSVFVDIAGLGCSVTGPGPVARVYMAGLDDGTTPLVVRSVILRDSANQTIQATSTPSEITISCPVPVSDRSWTTMKEAYRKPDAR